MTRRRRLFSVEISTARDPARYAFRVSKSAKTSDNSSRRHGAGLCSTCRFMRKITSDRGSVFIQCGKSVEDPSFPKYPRLPVVTCRGYERIAEPTRLGPTKTG